MTRMHFGSLHIRIAPNSAQYLLHAGFEIRVRVGPAGGEITKPNFQEEPSLEQGSYGLD